MRYMKIMFTMWFLAVMGKENKHKANGNTRVKKKAEVEENTESVMDKKEEQPDGVTEMEEDKTSEKVQEDALKKEKSSKKRPRSKGNAETKDNVQGKEPEEEEKEQKSPTVKKTKGTSVQKEEPKTPSASTIERPVRARKSVERLVAAVEDDSAKELIIEKVQPLNFQYPLNPFLSIILYVVFRGRLAQICQWEW